MMSRSMRAPRLGWLLLAAGIWAPLPALALSFDAALQLAEQHTPILQARAEQVEAARYAAVPAGELPDPKLLLGLQNVPLEGDGRYRLNEDGMSMQMIGLMQDVPSRAKRQAEIALASAGLGRAEASACWCARPWPRPGCCCMASSASVSSSRPWSRKTVCWRRVSRRSWPAAARPWSVRWRRARNRRCWMSGWMSLSPSASSYARRCAAG